MILQAFFVLKNVLTRGAAAVGLCISEDTPSSLTQTITKMKNPPTALLVRNKGVCLSFASRVSAKAVAAIFAESPDVFRVEGTNGYFERPETVFDPAHDAVLSKADLVDWAAALLPDASDEFRLKVRATLALRCSAYASPEERAKVASYQRAADALGQDGHIEVDEAPAISLSKDGGAYVQAWLWVSGDKAAGL
jgi:hypothetical protein